MYQVGDAGDAASAVEGFRSANSTHHCDSGSTGQWKGLNSPDPQGSLLCYLSGSVPVIMCSLNANGCVHIAVGTSSASAADLYSWWSRHVTTTG